MDAVSGVEVEALSNALQVSWTPATDGGVVEGYYVQVTGPEDFDVVVNRRAPAGSMIVTGLRNGVRYEVRVIAANRDGSSPASEVVEGSPTSGAEGVVAGVVVEFTDPQEAPEGEQVVPGEDAITEVDLAVDRQVGGDAVLVEFSEPVTESVGEQIADELERQPEVAWAEPDLLLTTASETTNPSTDSDAGGTADGMERQSLVQPVAVPADAAYGSSQWNLWDEFGIAIGDGASAMTDAWVGPRGKDVTVAVIDTGITGHPDLNGQLVPGFDFVSNPEQLAASRQPNAPPVPFDADYTDTSIYGPLGWDADPSDPGDWRGVTPVRDSSWHGTQIAGLIAAATNNDAITGIAPEANIQPVRALSWRGGLLSDIASAITWASGGEVPGAPANANPAKVINLSFTAETTCPRTLQEAITTATEGGALVIAAAGNANDDAAKFTPGNCGGVLTVGATNRDGHRATYSNHGETIDISAPGGDPANPITTLANTGTQTPDQPTTTGAYGTSLAAAHATAAAAILFSRNTDLTPQTAFNILSSKAYAQDFNNQTCDPNDPTIECGPGILTLAQIANTTTCSPVPTQVTTALYEYYSFTTTGNCDWTLPPTINKFDALVVAGGGGGGGRCGGGGGAGGFREEAVTSASAGATLSIAVGAGGAGTAGVGDGGTGQDSSVAWSSPATGSLVSKGGGGGGGCDRFGLSGGSGGGGGGGRAAGSTVVGGQGFAGGAGRGLSACNGRWCGGGGGGAGSGGVGAWTTGGAGGAGKATTMFNDQSTAAGTIATDLGLPGITLAGGGGGGAWNTFARGAGGTGGGGVGGGTPSVDGGDGVAFSGSGGGGAGYDPNGTSGDGGSGVVVVRVQTARTMPFTAPPSTTGVSGQVLADQPVVELLDSSGSRITGDNSTQVTATVSGAGLLFGTTTKTAVNGLVTFTDLRIASETAASYTLTFTSNSPNPLAATAPVSITLPSCPAAINPSGDPFTYWVMKDAGGCTWTTPAGMSSLDYLVVAGGGGGGAEGGGGGGGGGFKAGQHPVAGGTTYNAHVGFGGVGGRPGGVVTGGNGLISSFDTVAATGGGGGGAYLIAGLNGGSGGGGGATKSGGTGESGEGHNGGTGGGGAGGGGGAAAAGVNSSLNGGQGGPGDKVNWITPSLVTSLGVGASDGTDVWFAGGGGGSHTNTQQFAAAGGRGGGGYGGGNRPQGVGGGNDGTGFDATAATGGGGGGGDSGKPGGSGSTGVVVLRTQTLQSLVLTTQPSGTLASGDTLATQPVLELRDLNATLATTDNSTQVTATISGDGRLTGTTTVTASGGIFTFTDLGVRNWQAETLTITFTANTPQPLTASRSVQVTIPTCSRDAQTSDDWYTYWVFKDYGGCEWTAPAGISALDYAVVAGGGGGGAELGGGGGAGGLRAGLGAVTGGNPYNLYVGFGGAGSTSSSNTGINGFDSAFDSIVADGGGGAGSNGNKAGSAGGSGGGGGIAPSGSGGVGTSGQGNSGGAGADGPGGGGGAGVVGSAGSSGSSTSGGAGGAGRSVSWITPTLAQQPDPNANPPVQGWGIGEIVGSSVYFAGGGGGSHRFAQQYAAPGGAGGGGFGGGNRSNNTGTLGEGVDGLPNTGGGGGGGDTGYDGGAGGSGVVVLRTQTLQELNIVTMPVGPSSSGGLLATQPVLELQDLNGAIARGNSATQIRVTATSGWTLGGTTTVTVSGGVATFTDLTLGGPVGTDVTLTFETVTPVGVYTLTAEAFVQVQPDLCDFTSQSTDNEKQVIGNYTYWVLKDNGGCRWLAPSAMSNTDYLVVAGGGGGGAEFGGGGGAGGVRSGNTSVVGGTEYAVAVGAGGAGSASAGDQGSNGFRSAFDAVVATGGGGGGSDSNRAGRQGGSGGGGGLYASGGTGIGGQGNNGGAGADGPGGGGGAGAVGGGGASSTTTGGGGGAGAQISWITPSLAQQPDPTTTPPTEGWGIGQVVGSSVYFGGGGGGSHRFGEQFAAPGGAGGGGFGGGNRSDSTGTPGEGVSGLPYTGGGGGGGDTGYSGGAGGSGVVVLRAQTIQTMDITTQPVGPSASGGLLLAQPVLELRDIDGALTQQQVSVVLTASAPNTPTLSCVGGGTACLTEVADVGIVTFEDVQLAGFSGEDVTLTFTTTGLDDALVATSVVRVAPAACPDSARTADDDYTYWTLTTPGNCLWTAPAAMDEADYLVVAGGGGGGRYGGGGAGGLLTGNASITPGAPMSISVGPGGAGGTTSTGGSNGSRSAFGPFVTEGGGGGATSGAGSAGGSGGGGAFWAAGGANESGQGNRGGNGSISGGGGGGATQAGSSPPGSKYGNHGFGGRGRAITWITPDLGVGDLQSSQYYFAGGGGASGIFNVRNPGAGGWGGGGTANTGAAAAMANTGGGGGSETTGGQQGGSGVVVLRTQTLQEMAFQTMPIGPAATGEAFQVQPILELRDIDGGVAGSDSVTQVTASVNIVGALTGTTTVTASNGIVEFTDLVMSANPGGYTITFTTVGLPTELTATAIVQVAPQPCAVPKTTDAHYTYWVETSGGCIWTAPQAVEDVDYVVIGGGGGGGHTFGGGGGAGGLRSGNTSVVGGTEYAVTVGPGGAGATSSSIPGENGFDSAFASVIANGGGGGGSDATRAGRQGGSGGGGGRVFGGGLGISGQGNRGGNGADGPGGGGGAGAAGSVGATSTFTGGAGGAGTEISWISDTLANSLGVGEIAGGKAYYGGGGGGSHRFGEQYAAPGGVGGGGYGGGNRSDNTGTPGEGVNGAANTGGGGGGGDTGFSGGNGGSGVVVVRAQTLQELAWVTAPVGPATTGQTLVTQPVLEVLDINGQRATTDSTTQVQVSVTDPQWTLGGTDTATAVNGVVTFTNLTLAGPIATDFDLTFTTTNVPTALTQVATVQVAPAPCATSNRSTSGEYTLWTLKTVGGCIWTAPSALEDVDYLVVAGGGGGALHGGGGAGGVRVGEVDVTGGATYGISVGAGGQPAASGANLGSPGLRSSFGNIAAAGGGGGASAFGGGNGGSGGGAAPRGRSGGQGNVPVTSPSQGNNGGSAWNTGGGGGGAGAPGQLGPWASQVGGADGGIGRTVSWINGALAGTLGIGEVSGSSAYFGGGGGAGAINGINPFGDGGVGGGGDGAEGQTASNGDDNTGGGGGSGGIGFNNVIGTGGSGGSGVVVVRHQTVLALDMKTAPVGGSVGGLLPTQPVLELLDADGNVVTSDSSTQVTVSLGAAPAGATLTGTQTVTAVNGVVRFTDLVLGNSPGSYTLNFATSGLPEQQFTQSATVSLVSAAGASLEFTTDPSASTVAGVAFADQPVVAIKDAFGNTVTTGADASAIVTLTVTSGSGTLIGTDVVTAVNGVATFTGLSMQVAGSGKVITAEAILNGQARTDTTPAFTIVPAAADATVSTLTPVSSSIIANGTATQVLTVQAKDQYGNNLTAGGATVAITKSSGTGTLGSVTDNSDGTYTATVTAPSSLGSASFTATLGGADVEGGTGSAVTASVDFIAGPATKYVVTPSSTSPVAGSTITVTAQLADANNNPVASAGEGVTWSADTAHPGQGFAASTSTTNGAGVATVQFQATTSEGEAVLISATDTNSRTGLSAPITTVAGTASKLQFRMSGQPAGVINPPTAGTTFDFQVWLTDVNGNAVVNTTGADVDVTLALGSGTGPLQGPLTGVIANNANLVAFTGLRLDTAGSGFSITAVTSNSTDPTLNNLTGSTFPFVVRPGAASQVVFTTAPSQVVAGAAFGAVVAVQDQFGNTVNSGAASASSVSVALTSGTGSLAGTATVTATGGLANFTGLSIDDAGSKTLTASVSGLTSDTAAFPVIPAAADAGTSTIAASPSTLPANGVGASLVTVTAEDAFGNALTAGGDTVTITSSAGTVGSVTDNGDGTYSALVTAPTQAATATVSAMINGQALTSTATITFSASAPASISVASGGGQSATAGAAVGSAITVLVEDAGGNPVDSQAVNFSVTSGGGSLAASSATTNSSGIATVPAWTLGTTAGANVVTASAGSGAAAVSVRITATGTPGTVTGFAVTDSGSDTALGVLTAGVGSQVRVSAVDANGNTNTAFTGAVTLTSTAFAGTLTATITTGGFVDAVAITPTVAGANRTITAAASGITAGTAATFTVTPGALASFTVTDTGGSSAIGNQTAGTPFNVRVTALDAFSNVKTNYTGAVSLTSGSFAGAVTATISSGGLVDGVAISPTIAGTGLVITAAAGPVVTATASAAFDVAAGAATQLVVTTTPALGASGAVFATQPVVQFADANGNQVSSSATVTVSATASAGTPVLTGTDQMAAVGGVVTFTDLALAGPIASTYTLTFTATGVTDAVVGSLALTGPGAATKLVVATPASSTNAAGTSFATQPVVQLTDSAGNVITTDSTTVITVSVASPAVLTGPTTVTVINGVASFAGLGLNGATNSNYSLAFSAPGITGVTQAQQITAQTGALTGLKVTGQPPSSVTIGAAISPDVTVQLVDAFGNAITTSGVSVSAAIAGATLSNATATTDANGVATFTNLSIVAPAGSAQLVFSSANLTDASSNSFTLVKKAQSITWTTITNFPVTTAQQQLTATAGSSLPVTYSLDAATTNSACTVTSSGVVTVNAIGDCSITASQAGNGIWAAASDVTQTIPVVAVAPGVPAISSVSVSDGAVTVAFTPPASTGGASITGYTITATPVGGGAAITSSGCTSSPCTLTGLANGTSYQISITANNTAGQSSAVTYGTNMTPSATALAVTSLSATGGNQSITATWTLAVISSGTFARYELFIKQTSTANYPGTPAHTLNTVSDSSQVFSGLTNGVSYDVKVVTVLSDNTTGSAEVSQTAATVPSAPQNVSVAAVSGTVADVSWDAPATNGGAALDATTPYTVTITTSTSGAASVSCGAISNRVCQVSGLTPGATYSVSVTAKNRLGDSTAGTATYNVPANAAFLTALVVDDGSGPITLTPSFASGTLSYTASVAAGVSSVTVTPTASSGASIDVNNVAVTSGSASGAITVSSGTSNIAVVVTAADGVTTQTYQVALTRAGPATQLLAATAPVAGNSEATLSVQPVITVAQASGAAAPSIAAVTVTASGGTLGGTTTVNAVNGTATFAGLTFTGVVGTTYTLTFTSPGLTPVTATITPAGAGAPAGLAFTTQPTTATAGGTFAVDVDVVDAQGNTITTDSTTNVSLSKVSGAGTLSGASTPVQVGSGIAGFTGLSLNRAGAVTLRASATVGGSSFTADSSPIVVSVGAAAALTLTQSTSGSLASGVSRTLTATITDAAGNAITSATDQVTFTQTNSGAGAGSVSGLTSVAAVAGVASIPIAGDAAGAVVLEASTSSFTSSALNLTVDPGAAASVDVDTSTGNLASGGTRAVTVSVLDAAGNTVTGASGSIALSQTNSGAGTVTGTGNAAVSAGAAVFTLTGADAGAVDLEAVFTPTSGSAITSATSSFTVIAGVATQIVLTGATTDLASGNARTLTATIQDAAGNTVTGASGSVVFTATGSGSVSGAGSESIAAGVASATLSGDSAGGMSVTAAWTTSGTTLTSSAVAFTVTAGDAASITLTAGSSTIASGGSTALTATIVDARGNTVTSATDTVTFTKLSGSGSVSGLPGTDPASAGVASVNVTGSAVGALQVQASATVGGVSVASSPISVAVSAGAPAKVLISGATSTLAAGATRVITATIADAAGNTVTSSSANVTLTQTNGGAGSVTGVGSVSAVNGMATFTVTGALAGTVDLEATSTGLTSSPSVSFTVTAGSAAGLSITTQPAGSVTGVALSTQPVLQLIDAGGNVVAQAGVLVTATLASGGGSLTGDTAVTNASGVATFTGLTITGSAGARTIEFEVTNLSPVTSSNVSVAKASQSIGSISGVPVSPVMGGAPFTVSAAAGSGLAVDFTSSTPSVCTASGTNGATISILGAGSCTIAADQPGDGTYDAAPQVTTTFNIGLGAQAALVMTSPASVVFGSTLTLAAAGGSGSGAVTFAPSGSSTCTVSGTTLTPGAAGSTCEITATKAADNSFATESSSPQTIAVTKANQVVSFTSAPSTSTAIAVGDTYTPAADVVQSGSGASSSLAAGDFSIATASSSVCSISSGVVTFNAGGTCVIEAVATGTSDVNAGSALQSITVGAVNQTISFAQPAGVQVGDASFQFTGSASSGLPVTYGLGSGTTNSACSVTGSGVVSVLAVGDCQITANQAGGASGGVTFAAAGQVTRTFSVAAGPATAPHISSVAPGDQSATIAFTAPSSTGGASITGYQLIATPVGGGASITSSACTSSPCTMTGLTNGTAYTFTIAAITSAGVGAATSPSAQVAPAAVASAVTGLAAVPGNTTLAVSWNALTTAQLGTGTFYSYQVSYRVAGSAGAFTACTSGTCSGGALTSRNTTATTISGLSNGTSYEVQVVAYTSILGSQVAGNTASVTQFPSTVPDAPGNVTVIASGSGSAVVSWSAPVSDGGSALNTSPYTVTATGSTGAASVTCTPTGAATSCTVTGMTAGAAYTFSITAANGNGTSTGGTATYSVPSADATLSALVITASGNPVTISPSFASAHSTYTASVANTVTSVQVAATATAGGAMVSIDGATAAMGAQTRTMSLAVGSNAMPIVVTATDGTTIATTTVTITRAAAPTPPGPNPPAPNPNAGGGGSGGGTGGSTTGGGTGGGNLPGPNTPAPAPVPVPLAPPSHNTPASGGGSGTSTNSPSIPAGAVIGNQPVPVQITPTTPGTNPNNPGIPGTPGTGGSGASASTIPGLIGNGATITGTIPPASGTTTGGTGGSSAGGQTFALTINGPAMSGTAPAGNGLLVVPGQPVSIGGSGFAANTPVGLFVMPAGTQVGQVPASSGGVVTAAPVIPASLTAGASALQITGTAADGSVLHLAIGINVQPAAEPVPNPRGDLPRPAAGGLYVMVNQVPVPTEPEQVGNRLDVTEQGATVRVNTRTNTGAIAPVNAEGTLVVTSDGSVSVSGTGMRELVDVFIFSTPTYLGRVMVNADGTFTGRLPIPDTLAPGRHTLQLIGDTRRGSQLAIALPLIKPAPITAAASTNIQYRYGSTTLTPRARHLLGVIAKRVTARNIPMVEIEYARGFSGPKKLARKRAEVAASYLTCLGVDVPIVIRVATDAHLKNWTRRSVQVNEFTTLNATRTEQRNNQHTCSTPIK